jgi:modification methylase
MEKYLNKIICGDCLEVMKSMPDNSIDCIITSPPYNKGYWSKNRNINNGFKTKSRRIDYDNFNDCLAPDVYELWQRNIIIECLRILKPTGSLFYNHIDILNNHQTIHPNFIYDFPLKQTIIWNRKNTPKLDKSYFFPITEYIFWIKKTKESKPTFFKNQAIYKKNIWEISSDNKNKFPAPFPLDIPKNCILSTTKENDIILDCFNGSGTTCLAAKVLGRIFIGIEQSKKYCEIANDRINGTLI